MKYDNSDWGCVFAIQQCKERSAKNFSAADRMLQQYDICGAAGGTAGPVDRLLALRRQLCVWAGHTVVVGERNPAVLHLETVRHSLPLSLPPSPSPPDDFKRR